MCISLAILVARVKILPSEPGINASKIKPAIDPILPQGVIVRQITEEPIALFIIPVVKFRNGTRKSPYPTRFIRFPCIGIPHVPELCRTNAF